MPENTPPGSPKSQSAIPTLPVNTPETPPNPPQWIESEPGSLESVIAGPKPMPDPFTGDFGDRTPTKFMERVLQSRKVTDPEDDALIAELMAGASPDSSEDSPSEVGYGRLAPPIPEEPEPEPESLFSTPGAPTVEGAVAAMQLPLREGQTVIVAETGSPIRLNEKEKSLSPLSEESEDAGSDSLPPSQSSVPETGVRRATSTRSTTGRAPLARTATGLASSAILGGSRLREELRSRKSYQSGTPHPQPQSLKFAPSLKGKEKEVARRPAGLERRITESQVMRQRINSMVASGSNESVVPAPEPKSVSPERPAPPGRAASFLLAFNPLNWVPPRQSATSERDSQQESEEGGATPAGVSGRDDLRENEQQEELTEETREPVVYRDWRKNMLRQQRAGRGDLSVITAPRPGESRLPSAGLLSAGLKSSEIPATPRASAGEFLTEIQERIKRAIEHLQEEEESFTFESLLEAMKTTAAKDYSDSGGEPFGNNEAITKETLDRVLAEIDSGGAGLDLNTRQQNWELRQKLEEADENLYSTLHTVNTKEEQIQELEHVVENLEADRDKLREDYGKLSQSLKDNQGLLRQYSRRGKVDESARVKQLQDDYDHLNSELEYSEEERALLQDRIDKLEKEVTGWTTTARVWEQFPGGVPNPVLAEPSKHKADGAVLALKDQELNRLSSALESLTEENIQVKAQLAGAEKSLHAAQAATSSKESAKDEEIKSMATAFDSLTKEYIRVKAELDKATAAASTAAASRDEKMGRLAAESEKLSREYKQATAKLAQSDSGATDLKDQELERLAVETSKLWKLYEEAKAELAKNEAETDAKDKKLEILAVETGKLVQELDEKKAELAKGVAETDVKDKKLEELAVETEGLSQRLSQKTSELAKSKRLEGSLRGFVLEADDQIAELRKALEARSSDDGDRKAAGKKSSGPSLPSSSPIKVAGKGEVSKGTRTPGGRNEPPSDPASVYHEPCQNCVPIYLYHPDSYLRPRHTTLSSKHGENSTTGSAEAEPKQGVRRSSSGKDSLRPSDDSLDKPWEPCCEHSNAARYCECQGRCPAHPCCEHWEQGSGCQCLETCSGHVCCAHYDFQSGECGCDETCDLHACCEHYGGGRCNCEEVDGRYHDVRDLKACPTWTHGSCSCCQNCYDHGACEHWKSEMARYDCQKPCEQRDLTGECEHPVNEETGEASCEKHCDFHPCCRHYKASSRPPTCACGGRCREHMCCEHWRKNTRICTCAKTCRVHRPEEFAPKQPKAEPSKAGPSESTGAYAKRRTHHFVTQAVPTTWEQSPIPTTPSKWHSGDNKPSSKSGVARQSTDESLSTSLPGGFRRPSPGPPPGGPSLTSNRSPPPIIGYVCLNHRLQPAATPTRRETYLSRHPSYLGQLFGNIFEEPPEAIWQYLMCLLFLPIWWLYNFVRFTRREIPLPLPRLLPKDAIVSLTRLLSLVYLVCLFIALKEERRIWLRANGATAAYMRDLRSQAPYPWWSPVEADPRLLEPWLGQVTETVHHYFFPRPLATAVAAVS